MSNVEDVKLRLAASVDQTQRAVLGINAVADQLDEALTRLRATALGSGHPALVDAVARLEQAKLRLDEASLLAGSAIDAANTYRALA
ncbi:MAG TPA: hypothetical protein VNV66_21195 [Pilimelia sp.]|nr:hypothetical protein [Pilimelia sp.]